MALAALAVSGAAQAFQAPAPADDAALVGRWQQGLTAELRRMPPAQREKMFGGDVLELTAEHRARLYPMCGRERAAWEQHGFQYLSGTWKIVGDHKVHVVLGALGKNVEQDSTFDASADELVFIGPKNPHEQMGRYDGALPQPCPAGATPRS